MDEVTKRATFIITVITDPELRTIAKWSTTS